MKRLFLLYLGLIGLLTLNAQQNFEWELIDSTAKSKSEIYTTTKVFIAEAWNSAQRVIQNDDKQGGVIIVKGKTSKDVRCMGGKYRYTYGYTISYEMRENKYRMRLKDVFCESTEMTSSSKNPHIAKIQPFEGDNCPPTGTFAAPGITKSKAIPMMAEVKQDLQNIVDAYKLHMLKAEVVDDNW